MVYKLDRWHWKVDVIDFTATKVRTVSYNIRNFTEEKLGKRNFEAWRRSRDDDFVNE